MSVLLLFFQTKGIRELIPYKIMCDMTNISATHEWCLHFQTVSANVYILKWNGNVRNN